MANLAKWVVQLEAQIGQYTRKLDEADRKMASFQKKQTQQLDGLGKSFASMAGKVSKVLNILRGGAVLGGLTATIKGLDNLAVSMLGSSAEARQFHDAMKRIGEVLTPLRGQIFEIAGPAMSALADAFEAGAAAIKNTSIGITQSFIAILKAADAATFGVQDWYSEQIAALEKQLALLQENQAGADDLKERMKAAGDALDIFFQQESKVVSLAAAATKRAAEEQKRALKEAETAAKKLAEANREQSFLAMQSRAAIARARGPGGTDYLKNVDKELDAMFAREEAIFNHTDDMTKQMQALTEQAARNMQNAFADFFFDPFGEGLDGMVIKFGDAIREMLANKAALRLFELLGGLAGSTNPIIAGIGNFFKRADGGGVTAGQIYKVNERGPEFFSPATGGRIIPLGAARHGRGITVNVDARQATDPTRTAAMVDFAVRAAVLRVNDQERRGR
jgi:hypothetical protein